MDRRVSIEIARADLDEVVQAPASGTRVIIDAESDACRKERAAERAAEQDDR